MSSGFDDLARSVVIGSCTPVSDVASGKLVLGVVIRTRAALCFFLFFFAFIHGRDDVRKENGNCIFPPPSLSLPPQFILQQKYERAACEGSSVAALTANLVLQKQTSASRGVGAVTHSPRVEKAPLFSVTPITHPAPSAAVVVLTKAIQMGC